MNEADGAAGCDPQVWRVEGLAYMRETMRAFRRLDYCVIAVCLVLFVLHFALGGFASRLLSPWLIGAIIAGWVTGRIAIDRIERS